MFLTLTLIFYNKYFNKPSVYFKEKKIVSYSFDNDAELFQKQIN